MTKAPATLGDANVTSSLPLGGRGDDPTAATDVSVIICTRNRSGKLARSLEALSRQVFKGSWQVIVVDNGSTDDTRVVVKEADGQFPVELRYVYEAQPGLGRARNTGIADARGTIIAFTDDDCYAEPDWLSSCVSVFTDPSVGYVTGRVLLHDPEDFPVTINTSEIPKRFPRNRYLPTDGIVGANLAFRSEVLKTIGGFDPLMGAGTLFAAEDVDAVARAGHLGYEGVYEPRMVVSHDHGRRGEDVRKLWKSYDIGRGAYHVKLLMAGRLISFCRALAGIRFRMGGSKAAPFWEIYGSLAYVVAFLRSRRSPDPSHKGAAQP